MNYDSIRSTSAKGTVRTLSQQEELPLLRDHLLRLDRTSRHDRFHGFIDDSFIRRYAERCANDGTVIIAYFEDGVVRGAARIASPGAVSGCPARDRLQRRAVGAAEGRRQHPVPQADRRGACQGLWQPAHHHRRAERCDAGARYQVRCPS
ncbi:hypothetical protein ABIF39_008865 [Bradyrhizobium diazoefficiens]